MTAPKSTASFLTLRLRLWDVLTAGGVVASIATLLGFLGDWWWGFDLFSHFRVQYFLGLSAVAIVLVLRRQYWVPACFGLFAIVNLCTIAPFYFGGVPLPSEGSRTYRSLLMNVNTESGDPARVAQTIRQLEADLIVLEEVSDRWLSALSPSLRDYPYSEVMPSEDNFGIALFSKHPLVRSEIKEIGEAGVPSVIAEVELPDGRITVIGTHPLPPNGAENSRMRNDQLAQLPAFVRQVNGPVLLLGDLNGTPWCVPFRRLLRETGLRDSSQGRGVLPTWPTYLPLLLIPLDHCLHSGEIHVATKQRGPRVGSDHYPLVVDFVLTTPAPKISTRR
jgi:endonuclease/exonuclease/phosphatase (EEP) superfamily protein YafD